MAASNQGGAIRQYLRALSRLRRQVESTPELSLRPVLLTLAEELARVAGRSRLIIAQEASRTSAGQPDVYVKDGPRLVGFFETKAPDAELARLLRQDKQIKRYRGSLPNWILTDYYQFILIRDGEIIGRASVSDDDDSGDAGLLPLLTTFLDYSAPVIRTPAPLAKELARRTRILRDGLESLIAAEPEDGPLRTVLTFYQRTLMDDLNEKTFADSFAQTLVYGMFLARLRQTEGDFTRQSAAGSVPASVPFLRSAVKLLNDDELLPPPLIRLLDDLAALLDNTEIEPIKDALLSGGLAGDLAIHFYERFLKEYDAGARMKRGVYYTPPELVLFVVRETQSLLQRRFAKSKGLADTGVVLLDPAAGTGTFLLGAAEQALAIETGGTAAKKRLIREHIIPNFCGFELLPAPYAVAHLKLITFLEHEGYAFGAAERVRVYLTNTLEVRDAEEAQGTLPLSMLRGIVDEARASGRVKRTERVLVIVGNPPYERTSHNTNTHSEKLQEDFFVLDGQRLPDSNPAPLRDDYLRFIRWSTWKLLEQPGAPGVGVLAFVTNRAFLERPLHRAVRRFLLGRFDEIHSLDLHGDQREWYRDRVDEKVFKDVQAGIAITLFVKHKATQNGLATVRYRESFGTRAAKLKVCAEASLTDRNWRKLEPRKPLWLFVPYEIDPAYDTWPSVTDLIPGSVSGVQTHRDSLVIATSKKELLDRLKSFADKDVPDSEWEKQGIKSNRDWNLGKTREKIRLEAPKNVIRWTFRPFDRRWIAFDGRLIDYTRTEFSPHLLARKNLALVFAYGSLSDGPYAFVSRTPVPAAAISWRTIGQAYFAPLWIKHLAGGWHANVADALLPALEAAGVTTTAEALYQYVYAVLNSPEYRTKYGPGLRYGFGRIPLAKKQALFDQIAALGKQLIELHLLEDPALAHHEVRIDGDDQSPVTTPTYDANEQTLKLSPDLVAHPIEQSVWEYQQGAYRVLQTFVEGREGKVLDAEQSKDLCMTVAAIRATLRLLPGVDEKVRAAASNAFTAVELGFPDPTGAGGAEQGEPEQAEPEEADEE